MKSLKRNKKAFTILELLVVVAIIAVLAVIATPQFLGAIDKSRVSAQIADLNAINKAVVMYNFDTSTFPEDKADLNVKAEGVTNYNGPYMNAVPTKDKWGGAFNYNVVDEVPQVTLESVPLAQAKALETAIDQTVDPEATDATGAIQYVADVDDAGLTTVTYIIR